MPAASMEAQELTTYCATRRPPAFAEGAEADRLGALSRLVSGAGLPQPDLSPAIVASNPSPLIETAARRLVSDADLETGALGNELVTQAWTVLCYETDVEAWLPSLCAPMNDDQALLALRKRVIADIARLPSTALDRFAPQLPPEARETLRLTAAVLDTITQSFELYHLAKRMAHDTVSDVNAAVRNPCSLNDPEPPLRRRARESVAQVVSERLYQGQQLGVPGAPNAAQLDPMVLASRVLLRVLQDGPALDRPDAYYAQVMENELRRALGNPGWALSPLQRQAAEALMRAIRAAKAIQARMPGSPDPRADLVELARTFASVVEHAASLAMNRHIAPPPAVVDLVAALVNGQLERALDVAASLVPQVRNGPVVSPRALSTLRKAIQLASVLKGEDARRVAFGMLVPVGPWSERYLFDINGGALKLEKGDLAFAGDGGLGYNADGWGGFARGEFGAYQLSTPEVFATTRQGGGSLEAWMLLADDGVWRFEGRLSAGAHFYRTTQTVLVRSPVSNDFFTDERSTMGRGQLMAGIRYQPDMVFAVGLWAGGGVQYEHYQPLNLASNATTIALEDDRTTNYLFTGRLQAQYRVLPGWLALRLRGDAKVFRIKREDLKIEVGTAVTTESAVTRWTQLEASGRLFVDGDALRAMQFVPGIYGGLDAYVLSSDAGTERTVVPVVGVGVRRDVF